jgi:cytochrome c biogenesis factor
MIGGLSDESPVTSLPFIYFICVCWGGVSGMLLALLLLLQIWLPLYCCLCAMTTGPNLQRHPAIIHREKKRGEKKE